MSDKNSKNASLLLILLIVIGLTLGITSLVGSFNKSPFYTDIRNISK